MDDIVRSAPNGSWVDAAAGTVDREAFVGEDVFRQELDRIFHRLWIFLAHDTEIPEAKAITSSGPWDAFP